MPGMINDLSVAATLFLRATGRKLLSKSDPEPDLEKYFSGMQGLLDRAPEGLIQDYEWLDMLGNRPPWVASGTNLQVGDEVSCFLAGRVFASRPLDIWLSPALQVWFRVGDGEIFRGAQNGHSFIAKENGALQFGNYFPNDWENLQGERQQDDKVYEISSGMVRILIIRWHESAIESLREMLSRGDFDGYLKSEIARLEVGDTTPKGWSYLWNVGRSAIFHHQRSETADDCIHCQTQGDTGILQKKVDMVLDENTEISWQWCVDQLPSTLREDTVPSHDYLSIAVEFDNGRDITYYWSSTLSIGTGYDCPLPNWQGKEYHVVIRSGKEGLGEWKDERRNLFDDYKEYMGEPPARVVRVWLIANSAFQRNKGDCKYANIVLHNKDTLRVL